MYEDIFEMFQSWCEPKFCIIDLRMLWRDARGYALNIFCWKFDLVKHANVQPRLVNTDVLYATTLSHPGPRFRADKKLNKQRVKM